MLEDDEGKGEETMRRDVMSIEQYPKEWFRLLEP